LYLLLLVDWIVDGMGDNQNQESKPLIVLN